MALQAKNPGSTPGDSTMIDVNLNLTDRQAGYLTSAVMELYHKMIAASKEEYVVVNLDERIQEIENLVRQVNKQTKVL